MRPPERSVIELWRVFVSLDFREQSQACKRQVRQMRSSVVGRRMLPYPELFSHQTDFLRLPAEVSCQGHLNLSLDISDLQEMLGLL